MRFGKLVLLLMLLIFSINFVSGVQVRFQLGSVQDDCDVLGVGSACSGGDGATIWVVNLDTWNTVCLSNQDTTLSLTPGTYIASIASYPDNNAVEAKISVIGDGYVNNIKEIKTSTQWKDCMTAGTCVSNYDSLPYARLKNGICTSNPLLSDVADRIGSAGIDWVRVGYKFRVSTCPDNQVIMRLSSTTNAHGEVWNGASNYPNEICYDEIFGSQGNGIRTCSGTNKVLGLSDVTNAHAEKPENTAYTTPVCYGNLVCTARSVCNLDERMVVSLSADTNAHLEASGSYDVKICCKVGILGQRYWAAMDDENAQIDTAEVLDSVKLIWKNTGLAEGSIVSFEIFEDDPLSDDAIRTGANNITAIVSADGTAVGVWTITQADFNLGDDTGEVSPLHFFFDVGEGSSNNLAVEKDSYDNAKPTAVILEPVSGSKFLKNQVINFKQASHDKDDDLKAKWEFGDEQSEEKENCMTNNCDTTHSYTTSGTKIISLTAQEMTRANPQSDIDYRQIFVYEQGVNVFSVIASPPLTDPLTSYDETVSFDGKNSYAADCSLTCPAGKTCYQVSDGITILYCYDLPKTNIPSQYNLKFNWTFDEGGERAGWWNTNYNGVVEFDKHFSVSGIHKAELEVGYSVDSINIIENDKTYTFFNINYPYQDPSCSPDGNYWIDSSGWTPSQDNCHKDNVALGSANDCCPSGYDCFDNVCILNTETPGCQRFTDPDSCNAQLGTDEAIEYIEADSNRGTGFCSSGYFDASLSCDVNVANCRCEWDDKDTADASDDVCAGKWDINPDPRCDDPTKAASCNIPPVTTREEGGLIYQSWDSYYEKLSGGDINCGDSNPSCDEQIYPRIEPISCVEGKCTSNSCKPGYNKFVRGETELPFFGIFQFIGALILVFLFYFIKERKFKEKK